MRRKLLGMRWKWQLLRRFQQTFLFVPEEESRAEQMDEEKSGLCEVKKKKKTKKKEEFDVLLMVLKILQLYSVLDILQWQLVEQPQNSVELSAFALAFVSVFASLFEGESEDEVEIEYEIEDDAEGAAACVDRIDVRCLPSEGMQKMSDWLGFVHSMKKQQKKKKHLKKIKMS